MYITKEIQQVYRNELTELEQKASVYVESYINTFRAIEIDASVSDLRNAAILAIQDALNAFGDQAAGLACDLFDSIMKREGIDAVSEIYDVIDPNQVDKKVRFFASKLVNGDLPGFTKSVTALTKFYVKRSAYDNMIRNCHQNDVRYARVPSGRETCAFCFMLSSRGFVYHSEKTARGRSLHGMHQHCDCIVVPGVEGVTKIAGYDPDLMYERWKQCARTVGIEADLYSFKNRSKIIEEVSKRDWKWLYSDKKDRSSRVGYDSEWVDYERETARQLGLNGFKVIPIKRSTKEFRKRKPDFTLNSISWEMKNPENATYLSVWNQFKKAVCGKKGLWYRNPQCDRLVIGCSRSGMSLEQAVGFVNQVSRDEIDSFPEIKEVLLINEEGVIRVKR